MKFHQPTAEDMARFLSKIVISGPDQCWIWTGFCNHKGYPSFSVDGRMRHATQVSLEWLARVDVSSGYQALHSCDNPPCVNPTHLFAGDNATNMTDRDAKGRCRKGQSHHCAVVTDDDITRMFARRAEGWTLSRIADEAKCSMPTVSEILNGRTRVSHPLVSAARDRLTGLMVKRYSAEERREILSRRDAGEHPDDIARALNRPVRGVYQVLRRAG